MPKSTTSAPELCSSGADGSLGWSSSAAQSVFKFLKSHGRKIEGYGFLDALGGMCYTALHIARD